MSSRRTSKCSPRRSIGRAAERDTHTQTTGGHTHKHGCKQFKFETQQHILHSKNFCLCSTNTLIEMLVHEASWWPSGLRGLPCNHATMGSNLAKDAYCVPSARFSLLVFPVCCHRKVEVLFDDFFYCQILTRVVIASCRM